MADIEILKTELTTDPLVRGYAAMNNHEATDDLNLFNRPAQVTIEVVLKFLNLDNVHSTDGSDTQDRSLWLRLKDVAALYDPNQASAVANPWGATTTGVPNITEIRVIKSLELLEHFTLAAQGGLALDLTDSNFAVYLAGAQTAGVMSTTQETALLALADNLETRGREIGFGTVKAGHVAEARA